MAVRAVLRIFEIRRLGVVYVLLRREFTFDAAHCLSKYHGKCDGFTAIRTPRRDLGGKPDEEGMLFDFVELKGVVQGAILSSSTTHI